MTAELTRCIELCEEIRANRRLGSTQENLDRLQSSLESGEMSLPTTYNDIRKQTGSRMDIGDEKARNEMNQHLLSIQTTLKPRLKEIAYPTRPRARHEKEQSGFVDLHRQWKVIHRDASETIISLSRRITTTSVPAPPSAPTPPSPLPSKVKPASSPTADKPKSKKSDDITISLTEFHHMLAHMQNSWEEVVVGGRIMYVNCLDKEKKSWEMPAGGAFIKTTPRLPTSKSEKRKTVSWDTTSLRTERTTPSWERPYARSFKIPEWEQRQC